MASPNAIRDALKLLAGADIRAHMREDTPGAFERVLRDTDDSALLLASEQMIIEAEYKFPTPGTLRERAKRFMAPRVPSMPPRNMAVEEETLKLISVIESRGGVTNLSEREGMYDMVLYHGSRALFDALAHGEMKTVDMLYKYMLAGLMVQDYKRSPTRYDFLMGRAQGETKP